MPKLRNFRSRSEEESKLRDSSTPSFISPFGVTQSPEGNERPGRALRSAQNDMAYFLLNAVVSLKEIMFFDDSEENTVASEELGMQAVLVNSPADVAKAVKPFLRDTP